MTAPGYAWTCLHCDHKNGAERESCEVCTLPARFTARQLAQIKRKDLPDESAYDAKLFRTLLTFVPEGFIALACIIYSPVRGYELLEKGRIGAAAGLFLALAAVIAAVYIAIVRKEKWLAYAAVLAYMLCLPGIFR